ncbi:hypothetical protein GCK32_000161 [Trichostrongylus colubriformis]|uniref:Uncharacterized protein n=1 Tax=Trichostrongylus colubriformis TaxID=6319 RepID=A0AAN8FQ39_TRICO
MMQQIKSLLNPKIVIPVASVLVFLVAGTLVTIFYIRNPTVATSLFTNDLESTTTSNEGDHRATEAPKPGGAATNSMMTSARVVIQSLTTVLSTPSHLETSTVSTAGGVSDPMLDNSANTVHAIESTKRE